MDNGSRPDLMTRFESLRRTWWPAMRALIEGVVQEAGASGSLLHEMVEYHIDSGGKRLRATLPLLVAEALEVDPARLAPFGAACEMLHNASLVHDDLQDGDSFRRGREAVWKKYGKAQAINLGDAMIAYSILLMQRLDFPPALKERATSRLLVEMLRVIGGQVQDLNLKHQDSVGLREYLQMVEGKTARLFALPMGGAGLLCGVPPDAEEGLIEAACQIGVLFQIEDDVLDVFAPGASEPSGADIREGKPSVLVIHCLESASTDDAAWLRAILNKPREETSDADIAGVKGLFRKAGSLDFALNELARRHQAGVQVPGLSHYPALVDVLNEACNMFLHPLETLFPGFQSAVDVGSAGATFR